MKNDVPNPTDCWNPEQYKKFEKERNQPFFDLIKMIHPKPDMSVLDLGCGDGGLTRVLHDHLSSKKTLGIDSSLAMLKNSYAKKTPSLHFQLEKIEDFKPNQKFDLIFSNAALQWVPNHIELFESFPSMLEEKGQVAIQMPDNFDFPTHRLAKELALEPSFSPYLDKDKEPSVLPLEVYSDLLFRSGFKKQDVRIQVYSHLLESTDSVIQWVKGTLLTYYESELPKDKFELFLNRYIAKIKDYFGEKKPFFLPFKRILIWGEL